jgi:hypothetical protein
VGEREVVVPVAGSVADPVAGILELVNRWAVALEAKAKSKPGAKRIFDWSLSWEKIQNVIQENERIE